MKCELPTLVFWIAVLFSFPAIGEEAISKPPPLKCETGPVAKTYGGAQWLVYSCSDSETVVIVSALGNPAMPFYFSFSLQKSGYQLNGEGTGRKDATNAAFDELKALSHQGALSSGWLRWE